MLAVDTVLSEAQARIASLEQTVAQLEQALAERDGLIAGQKEVIGNLRELLDQTRRLLYDKGNERYTDPDALPPALLESLFADLFPQGEEVVLEEEAETVEIPRHTRRKKRKKGKGIQCSEDVPVEVVILEPEGSLDGWKKIGEVRSEKFERVPGYWKKVVTIRPKYAKEGDEDAGIRIAPAPKSVVPGCSAGPELLAHIAGQKFLDHMPLYRQVQRFRREGVEIAVSTTADWMRILGEHLRPLFDLMVAEILDSGYIQADETRIPSQQGRNNGRNHQSYWWVYFAPILNLVAVTYSESRREETLHTFLKGYQGALQSDGYIAYENLEGHPDIELHGCWAHVRRKFRYLTKSDPDTAKPMLAAIKLLYAVERRLREAGSSPEERVRVRQAQSVPILNAILKVLDDAKALPRSALRRAGEYTTKRWEKLTRFTEDGRIEIDNNLVENAIRPLALGRKNYLFVGSHRAGRATAVLYTLFGTCKRHGVNPEKWLVDVLKRIGDQPQEQLSELLPHRWSPLEEEAPP